MSGSPKSPEDEKGEPGPKVSPGFRPPSPSKLAQRKGEKSGVTPRPPPPMPPKADRSEVDKAVSKAKAAAERMKRSESGVAIVGKQPIFPPNADVPKVPLAPLAPLREKPSGDASKEGERKPSPSVPTQAAVPTAVAAADLEDSSATMRPPGLSDDLQVPDEPLPQDSSIDVDISMDSVPPGPESLPFLPSLPVTAKPFGRYHLLGRLAVGGMAEIFLASERTEGGAERRLVVKMARPHLTDLTGFDDMFMNEGRVAMRLAHPNIAHVYEFGKQKGRYFLAMEWVNGASLRELTRRARERGEQLPVEVVVKIISQVADALDYAHRLRDGRGRSLNIVHRDVSPHNVMISYEGAVKLLDFGVAKGGHTKETTQSGTVKGKFNYMSPQQCTGRSVDGRADIFSLGVCLWEALTAKSLFKRETQYETFKAIIEDDVPKLSKVRDDVPKELDTILEKAMAKTLGDRYKTAGDFHDDLARFLQKRGEVVSSSRVSRYMESLFADELSAGPALETSEEIFARIAPAESLDAGGSSMPSLAEQAVSRNKWMIPMIAGGLGVLAGVVLIAVLAGGPSDDAEDPPPPGATIEAPDPEPPAMPTMEVVAPPAPVMETVRVEEAEATMAAAEVEGAEEEREAQGAEEEVEEEEHHSMRRSMRRRGMRTMGGFVTDPGF